jgi:hypothetical protein
VKKEQNGRKSLTRLKPTVGCNASKRRRRNTKQNAGTFFDFISSQFVLKASSKVQNISTINSLRYLLSEVWKSSFA